MEVGLIHQGQTHSIIPVLTPPGGYKKKNWSSNSLRNRFHIRDDIIDRLTRPSSLITSEGEPQQGERATSTRKGCLGIEPSPFSLVPCSEGAEF